QPTLMLPLVVFVSVIAFSWATTSEEQAQVIVETYFDFDENMSSSYLEIVRSTVEELEESYNVLYNPKQIDVKAENIDGRFAAVYTVHGVDCNKLDDFVSAIKGLSALAKQVTVTCGGKTITL
ncbi:hypothetical protein V3C99_012557, partial [Haemonchus contortus]